MTEQHADADLLYGTKPTAEFLKIPQRRVQYLAKTRRMPHFCLGRIICTRPTTLMKWLDEQERLAQASEGDAA